MEVEVEIVLVDAQKKSKRASHEPISGHMGQVSGLPHLMPSPVALKLLDFGFGGAVMFLPWQEIHFACILN